MNRKAWLMVCIVLLLSYGFFLRLYGVGHQSMWLDETISAVVARNIAESGRPVLDSGAVYSRAYVFHSIMAGSFLLFGENDFAARLPSVLFGVLTCLFIYLIARRYSTTAGLFALILSLFAEIEIVYSRQARMYQLMQLLVVVFLYLMMAAFEKKKYVWYAIPVFFLAYDTNLIAIVLLAVFGYYFFIGAKHNRILFLSGLGFIVLFMIWLHHGLLTGFNFSYITHYISFLRYYVPFAVVALIGVVLTWKRKETIILTFTSLFFLLATGVNLLFAFRYIYVMFPALFILAAVALSRIRFRWIVLVAYLVFASNIIHPISYTFILNPEYRLSHVDPTAPLSEFKGFYTNLAYKYPDQKIAVTLTAPALWYYQKPDYWIPISLAGFEDLNVSRYPHGDAYAGAPLLTNLSDFQGILIIDTLGFRRITPSTVNYINNDCAEAITRPGVTGFLC